MFLLAAAPLLSPAAVAQNVPTTLSLSRGRLIMRHGDSTLWDSGDTLQSTGPDDDILWRDAQAECTSNIAALVVAPVDLGKDAEPVRAFCASFWSRLFRQNRPGDRRKTL